MKTSATIAFSIIAITTVADSTTLRAQQDQCLTGATGAAFDAQKETLRADLDQLLSKKGYTLSLQAKQDLAADIQTSFQYQNTPPPYSSIRFSALEPLAASLAPPDQTGIETVQGIQQATDALRMMQIEVYAKTGLKTDIEQMFGGSYQPIYQQLQEQTEQLARAGAWKDVIAVANRDTLQYMESLFKGAGIHDLSEIEGGELYQMVGLFPRFTHVNICTIPAGAEVYIEGSPQRIGTTTILGELMQAQTMYRLRFVKPGCEEVVRPVFMNYKLGAHNVLQRLRCRSNG